MKIRSTMTNDSNILFLDFNEYIEYIKQNRKKLHTIAEQNLRIILKEICPETHPVSEINKDGRRVDLIFFFDSNGHSIHFEIIASSGQVDNNSLSLERSSSDIQVALLIDGEIDPRVSTKYFRVNQDRFIHFNLSYIFMSSKIEDFKHNIVNIIKKFKLSMKSEVQNSKLLQSRLVNRFRGYNPSKKDLLDLNDIKHNISKLKSKNLTPKDEERILKDISFSLSDIAYIETLKEESKKTLNNLLEFLYDFLLCKEDPTLNGVLKVLTWICRSEMLNTAKSIYYEYLVSLLDKKKRSYDLLEILFSFRHFEDRVLWLSTAIDEKNIDFINILSGDLGTPKLYEQKFEIRDMLYEKLDFYEQDGESQEIVQKINFLLQKLRNIKKSN